MENSRIAVVDDDPDVISLVSTYLTTENFTVNGFMSGEEFFEFLKSEKPDLIVLDRVLPGINGFEICKKLKEEERFSLIPIIMLSGKDDAIDKISGLNIGADDYLGKPFDLGELKARILAVLRSHGMNAEDQAISVVGGISIDPRRSRVMVNGKKVQLTFAEFKILELLASRPGQVFARNRILEYLWGDEKIVVERTVDVHVKHLREKLGEAGKFIKNVRGFGYSMETEDDE